MLQDNKKIESTAINLLFPRNYDKLKIRNVVRSMIRSGEIVVKSAPFKPSVYSLPAEKTKREKRKVTNTLNS